MDTIYKTILKKLRNRQFANINIDDYDILINDLLIDYFSYEQAGDKIPTDYYELQSWIYDRIVKDIKYQDTGYLNEHFCIGVIFGMLQMFDELTYDKTFAERLDKELN